MRLVAAVKWYEMRLISQSRAAEIAGISRREFLDQLARFDVSPFQYDADESVLSASVHESFGAAGKNGSVSTSTLDEDGRCNDACKWTA
jgi:hypothetical protein